MEQLDAEYLIDEVKKKKAIWDIFSEEYKNKKVKEKQWIEVCRKMFPNYDNMDTKEKQRLGKELGFKWRNIRDSYLKYVRQFTREELPPSGKRLKPYVYAKKLRFLIPNFRTLQDSLLLDALMENERSKRTDDQDDNSSNSMDQSVEYFIKTEVSNQGTEASSDADVTFSSPVSHRLAVAVSNPQANISQSPFVGNLPVNSFQPGTEDGTGSDDMDFFRSLLPILKPIPLYHRMQFRVDVMKLAMECSTKCTLSSQPLQTFRSEPQQVSNTFSSAELQQQVFPQQASNAYQQPQLSLESQPGQSTVVYSKKPSKSRIQRKKRSRPMVQVKPQPERVEKMGNSPPLSPSEQAQSSPKSNVSPMDNNSDTDADMLNL